MGTPKSLLEGATMCTLPTNRANSYATLAFVSAKELQLVQHTVLLAPYPSLALLIVPLIPLHGGDGGGRRGPRLETKVCKSV